MKKTIILLMAVAAIGCKTPIVYNLSNDFVYRHVDNPICIYPTKLLKKATCNCFVKIVDRKLIVQPHTETSCIISFGHNRPNAILRVKELPPPIVCLVQKSHSFSNANRFLTILWERFEMHTDAEIISFQASIEKNGKCIDSSVFSNYFCYHLDSVSKCLDKNKEQLKLRITKVNFRYLDGIMDSVSSEISF